MARKRGHGEGTAYYNEKRQRWEAQFSYRCPETGKIKRKMFTSQKSQKEAMAKGRKWLQELEGGLMPDADKLTLWQWLDRWLVDYKKNKVRMKTYDKYEGYLRLYIKPHLGDVPLLKLKAPDIQRVLNWMLEKGGQKGSGLCAETVRNTRRYLIMAFDHAIKLGLMTRNVAKDTEPPKREKKEITVLTVEEAERLLAAAKEAGEVAYITILLALSTGMRLGEVFGLKWEDVDLEKGIIHVRRSVATGKRGQPFQEPKTAKSRRNISLPQDWPANVAKELRKYKKWQDWQKHLLGDKWHDLDLVITNMFGKSFDASHFTQRVFKKLKEASGIDRKFTFHDLRHTHASILLKQGVNYKVVQERLGHSSAALTIDTYSHLMPGMQDAAINALDALANRQK